MKGSSDKVKKAVKIIVTILMILVIVGCIIFVLYTNKLLPTKWREFIDSVVFDRRLAKGEYVQALEKPFYEIIQEPDFSEYKEVEIMDLANCYTMVSGTFSQDVINKVSIIKADNKYGFISNETGEIIIKPKYDRLIKHSSNDNIHIYGKYGEKYDSINLKTHGSTKDVEIEQEDTNTIYLFDTNKEKIWTGNSSNPVYYEPNATEIEKYDKIGTQYAICLRETVYQELSTQEKELYGYFDLKTGQVLIKPEYDKVTLFNHGVAGVKKDSKAYFISENNVKISDDYFEDVNGIHEFKSWIKIDGKWKLAYFPKLIERAEIYDSNKRQDEERNAARNVTNTIDNSISTNEIENEINNATNETNDKNIIEP